jgi:hypothetical protein
MMSFYWHIELYSGEIIKVRPDHQKIRLIQEKISKQEGSITTPTRSIIIKDIKDFRLSDEPHNQQKLLEGAAQAFKEPMFNDDGSIQARLVKKSVPIRRWNTHYQKIPSYRLLEDDGSFVKMAFVLPVHQIDHQIVQELTPDEEFRLAKITY